VGPDNFFLFGLTVEEVDALWARGYHPAQRYEDNARLRAALDLLASGHFSDGDTERFRPLVENLIRHDPYLVLADFDAYVACQSEVDAAFRDPRRWTRMSILNTARSGDFSSDRTIQEYASGIWRVDPVPVRLLTRDDVRNGAIQ